MNEVMVPLGGGPPSPANGEILGAAANKLPFRSGPLGLFPAQHPYLGLYLHGEESFSHGINSS